MFLFGAFPETLTGKFYVGPFPLFFLIFYAGCFGLAIELLVSRDPLPLRVLGLLSIMAALVFHGLIRGEELKWMMIDCSAFGGLIAGATWVKRRSRKFLIHALRFMLAALLPLLTFALIGLFIGLVPAGRDSGRLYTYSIFRAAAYLSILLPLLVASQKAQPLKRVPDWVLPATLTLGYSLLLASALFTATRSIFIGAIVSLLLTLRISAHEKRMISSSLLLIAALLLATLFAADILPSFSLGTLGERLTRTQELAQEERWQEIEMLFTQLQGSNFWTGLGFGSRFESPVIVDGLDVAINPHIAIFTFLQKGGILFFLSFIVFPYFFLFTKVIRGNCSSLQLGTYSGALLYLFLSSMSAGWEFYSLFLYGSLMSAEVDG